MCASNLPPEIYLTSFRAYDGTHCLTETALDACDLSAALAAIREDGVEAVWLICSDIGSFEEVSEDVANHWWALNATKCADLHDIPEFVRENATDENFAEFSSALSDAA